MKLKVIWFCLIFEVKMAINQNDITFLKILLNKIDPIKGEAINLSDDCVIKLRGILNGLYKENFNPNQSAIVEEYRQGSSVPELMIKYNIAERQLKKLLSSLGFRVVKDTYLESVDYHEKYIKVHNRGIKYTIEEDKALIEEYLSGKSVNEITQIHQRTRAGIEMRLVKLGFADYRESVKEFWSFTDREPTICSETELSAILHKYKINEATLQGEIESYLYKNSGLDNELSFDEARNNILHFRYNIVINDKI